MTGNKISNDFSVTIVTFVQRYRCDKYVKLIGQLRLDTDKPDQ